MPDSQNPTQHPASLRERLLQRARTAEAGARGHRAWLAVADIYARLEALSPEDHRPAANRGHALWMADRPDQALRAYWRAASLAPDEAIVLRGLGTVLSDQNAFELADRAYARSQELEPSAETAWNHSQLLIGLERFKAGYSLAESRWQLPGVNHWRQPDTQAATTPQDLVGPLLIWSEQGFGDSLQHLRWLGPLLTLRAEADAPLLLEVEEPLISLLGETLPRLGQRWEVKPKPASGPSAWDGVHCSLLSLPWLLGGAPLPADAFWLDSPRWPAAARGRPERLRIGLVWAAGRKLDDPVTAREYERRSLTPALLSGLIEGLQARGMEPVLLQFGPDRAWADCCGGRTLAALAEDADFGATAALVAELDLVISVDTAMAHLVGAMRRPGWILLPFSAAPRWLRQRPDTPWYPSLRLFRQEEPGNWPSVLNAVLRALDHGQPWDCV